MPRTLVLTLLAAAWLPALARADVRVVRAPNRGQVPDVAVDARGTLHLTYGTGQPGNAFYVQSRDGGKTFSKPVKLNPDADTVTCGMERGPRLALGKDGAIHVIWHGFYKKGGGVYYTRSTDGGRTFAPPRRLEEPQYGLDNAALAADGRGNVYVLWTGGFPGFLRDPESEVASPIIWVRSTDNGATFSKNELLKSDHPASGAACGCCRLEARVAPGGELYIAFRGGYKGLRDPWLLRGKGTENNFKCVRVSEDKWAANCPMQGIPLNVDGKGRVTVSWMSRNRAYWKFSTDGGATFAGKSITTPDQGTARQSFPLALPNIKGQVLLVWAEGGQVRWAVYRADGTPTTERGVAGPQTGQNRPTAILGADGNFYVVP